MSRANRDRQSQSNYGKNWRMGLELAFIRDRLSEIMRDKTYQPTITGDASKMLEKAADEIGKALSIMEKRMTANKPKAGDTLWPNDEHRARLREVREWSASLSGFVKLDEAQIAENAREKPP